MSYPLFVFIKIGDYIVVDPKAVCYTEQSEVALLDT